MSKKNLRNILSVSARILLSCAFVFGQTAWAGQNQGIKEKAETTGKAKVQQPPANQPSTQAGKPTFAEEESDRGQNAVAERTAPSGGPHEGIKVHGHWTIEVRNSDGSVSSHQEFENSLASGGTSVLGAILSRQNAVGLWRVVLQSSLCVSSTVCNVDEVGFEVAVGGDPIEFPNLTVSGSANGFALNGSMLAPQAGIINGVATQVILCPTSLPTGATGTGCGPAFSNISLPGASTYPASYLTGVSLDGLNGHPNAVTVAAGQTVAVTVNISFS
ncbi:MAG TPA: hypothetical protein VE263_07340 [Candidatus Angelobacter sp.]|nr:hypothetical protein [Candidatus Angelobacter sp.]